MPSTPKGSASLAGDGAGQPRLSQMQSTSSLPYWTGSSSTKSRTPSSPAMLKADMGQAMRRRVCFCPTPMNSQHAVTPYAIKYGQHPSLFHFDRKGQMQLSDKGVAEELRLKERKDSLDTQE